MSNDLLRAGVLMVFALVAIILNLLADCSPVLKAVSFIAIWVFVIGSGWFAVMAVLL